jgi:type VI secretion system protein ImpF
MATSQIERPVQQSVLDRLIDEDPKNKRTEPTTGTLPALPAATTLGSASRSASLQGTIDARSPSARQIAANARSASVKAFKAALKRDLEWLLNTRRIITPIPDECEELSRSVFTYGLPDITSMSKDSPESFERLARYIQSAIEMFEPRLTDVTVRLSNRNSKLLRDVHFVIDGILKLDPLPERVTFDTRQDESGAMKVEEEGAGGG